MSDFLRKSSRRDVRLELVSYTPQSKRTAPAPAQVAPSQAQQHWPASQPAPGVPVHSAPAPGTSETSAPPPVPGVTLRSAQPVPAARRFADGRASNVERDSNAPLPQRLTWFLFFLIVVVAVCSFALTACAPKPAKPVKARAQLVVSGDVNPDAAGRASPVVVRLFQLRNDGEFAAADFFALYEKEKETLGASLISREEYVLAPGETRMLDMAISPDARFVGALAAFRDIRAAHWRALTRTPEKKLTDLLGKHGLTLSVGKDTVTLAVED